MQLLNFRLHWQIWLFGPNLPKKGISSLNRNNKHGHWILHIRIRLATKFQLKLVILIFWTKFRQKGYFSSKTRKSEQHHWILHIGIRLATKFHLRLTCLIFSTKICPKSVFPVKNKKKSEQHHWILHIRIRLDVIFLGPMALLGQWRESGPSMAPLGHGQNSETKMLWHFLAK